MMFGKKNKNTIAGNLLSPADRVPTLKYVANIIQETSEAM